MYLKTFKNTVTDFIPNQYLCFELMFVYIEYKIHLYILSCSRNNNRVHQGVSHPLFLLMWLGETLSEMYSKFCCSEDKLEKHILYLHSSLHWIPEHFTRKILKGFFQNSKFIQAHSNKHVSRVSWQFWCWLEISFMHRGEQLHISILQSQIVAWNTGCHRCLGP